MSKKYNSYAVTIHTDYYVPVKCDDGTIVWDWASSVEPNFKVDSKTWEGFKTFQEALDFLEEETTGSRWIFYPSAYIEDKCCGEVWENTLNIDKCATCGHEEQFHGTSDSHHDTPEADYQLENEPQQEEELA